MAVCVSLINMKGGVGKTTLASQIAWYAVRQLDKKVLLIDLDPQANASQSVMLPQTWVKYLDDGGLTVADIFEQEGADSWYARPASDFLGPDYDPADYDQVRDIVVNRGAQEDYVFLEQARVNVESALASRSLLHHHRHHDGILHHKLFLHCGVLLFGPRPPSAGRVAGLFRSVARPATGSSF